MASGLLSDKQVRKLIGGRRDMLIELYSCGGELRASQIWQPVGVPRGSKDRFFADLEEWGLIEEVRREETDGPFEERVYQLTDDGETVATEDFGAQPRDVLLERVRELEGELTEVREIVEDNDDRIEKILTFLEGLQGDGEN